ncbi:MAG: PD-(D/E)XK nuclease family protein [Flavobacteriaceae bacterium]
METFLSKIAKLLVNKPNTILVNTTVVLPNRRAKIFLINQIRNNSPKTVFAPNIYSIQEFMEHISGVRVLDNVEQLFEFYKVYSDVSPSQDKQSFEQFYPWAKVLLKDFSDIDAHLVVPNKILQYLKEIKDIEHWSLSEKRTAIIEKHLKFWSLIPEFYNAFYQYLTQKKAGYQGLVFREAARNILDFTKHEKNRFFVFVGLNALTPSEEKVIQHLLKEGKSEIYWDIDKVFVEDFYNQAGYFIRKYKKEWAYYNSNPFEWIIDEFSKEKNINIIGTAKSVGQAKVVGNILEQQLKEKPESLNKTALILSEKSLLIPLLYSLPESVKNLNITLEYSARNNPVQFLINRIFRLHIYAKSRKDNYTFYYKDVLEVLGNPFVEPFAKADNVVEIIKSNNFSFLSHQRLYELIENKNTFFKLVFDKWPNDSLPVLDRITEILLHIKNNLNQNTESDKVTLAFVFEIHKIINQLKNYFSITADANNIENLYSIYKQVIDAAEVAFEGEPLSGLQIMGILESRTLDFENVIFTSMNEGKIPLGKSHNSFIPYDVKHEFGLPVYKDRDAIYTYHFYRLISRAKNIFLVYNTEDDGLDGGEKSRFITQLEIEKHPNHNLTKSIYNSELPDITTCPIQIEKSDTVMERLKEIAEKGFSPSSLSSYIRNPIDFYFQKVLKIDEIKEVEETIEANTLGSVIHNTLEDLYKPHIGILLTVFDVQQMEKQYEQILQTKFKEQYKEGEINKGKNLLAYESAKKSIGNFLKMEKESILSGDEVTILYLEERFDRKLEDEKLPFPVNISGVIDRIEKRNGNIRIVDYKTGKVDKVNLELSNWEDFLSNEKKNKIIQILSYVFMYGEKASETPIEAGIVSFKNLKKGFIPFGFKTGKEVQNNITPEIIEQYKEQTIRLLLEILDQNILFEEKRN